jgi:aryl-alcohol dehydrogenase-like predicted oxidoreductase
VAQLVEARRITPIVSVQNRYNVLDRRSEDVLEYCERHGIAFVAYFPVAPLRHGSADPIAQVAQRLGATRAQVALAWLLHKPGVTAPIVGASKPHHLKDAVAALSIKLTQQEISQLEEVYVPHPVLGHH